MHGRKLVLDLAQNTMSRFDVVIERCINHSRALYALKILQDWGIPCVNRYQVAEVCGNKLATTSALTAAGVPSPRTVVAFTPRSALEAMEELDVAPVVQGRQADRDIAAFSADGAFHAAHDLLIDGFLNFLYPFLKYARRRGG